MLNRGRRRPCMDCRVNRSKPGKARCVECDKPRLDEKNGRRRTLTAEGGAAQLRAEVRAAGGWVCQGDCREWHRAADLEIDHIIELEDGGADTADNVQPLCKIDHRKKSRDSRRARNDG